MKPASKVIAGILGLEALVIGTSVTNNFLNHQDERVQEVQTSVPERVVESVKPQEQINPVRKIDYKTIDFSQDTDQVLLARLILGEAEGQSKFEKIAVAYTAINRTKDGLIYNGEGSLRNVILKPSQYSCFNKGVGSNPKVRDPERITSKVFAECLTLAGEILEGKYEDPTNGANLYFNPQISNPKWKNNPNVKKIGYLTDSNGKRTAHLFYREN